MANERAYIPGFEHDIFVSYARVDDKPFPGAQSNKGWVTTFLECLKNELTRLLGRHDSFSVWWDETHLNGHSPVSDEIRTSLEGTAILIVIVSPGYLASKWCAEERNEFVKLIKEDRFENVFVIEQNAVEELPEVLRDRKGYRFWHDNPHPMPLGHPSLLETNEDYRLYFREMNKLAYELKDFMKKLKLQKDGAFKAQRPQAGRDRQHENRSDPDDASSQVTIYVAEPTDDLSHYSDRLSRTLEKKGFRVLPAPEDYLPREPDRFKQVVNDAIGQSDLFVQLAGPVRSRTIKGSDETFGSYQFRAAVSQAENTASDVMIWFSAGTQSDPAREQDDYSRELLIEQLQCNVHEGDFENFQEDVIHRAEDILKQRRNQAALPEMGGQQSIFIKCEPRDRETANRISQITGELDFFPILPPSTNDSSAFREAWDRNDEVSDATIVLYGPHSDSSWVQMQCMNSYSIKRQRQQRFLGFIVDVPPPRDKPDPGLPGVQRLFPLPDAEGFNEDELRNALQQLRRSFTAITR